MEEGGTPCSRAMAPSGSYVLIVVSHPVTEDHKEVILDRLSKGLLSWDIEATGCDLNGLEAVCSNITSNQLRETDVLIQHSTERLGVEVLVSPTVSTLKQCIKNLFSTSTGHKHLIHAGYAYAGTGSWILQNGTFSFDEFLDIFQHADVVRIQQGCHIDVHCSAVGQWTAQAFAKLQNVSLNPPNKVDCVPGAIHMINCLRSVLSTQALEEIMEASPLVGNIRFNRPTLYMFPAGQGDCALFGINGFNMLVDGGFSRKPCSWEFIRHLDRLDAVLVTRLNENNLCGMSTLMKRKALNNTYPQIGYVFCNIAEGKKRDEPINSQDELIVSVVGEGHAFVQTLNDLKLKPHQCWRDSSVEPFVLYHKVGFGTLEMHVLSPPKDSKEMKDFLSEWSSYKENFSCVKSGLKSKSLEALIPLSHATSICAILVWRPADPKDTITRIMFPGSAPQSKIFESLAKLKNLDILHQPTVTKASLTSKLVAKTKSNKLDVPVPNRKRTVSPSHSMSDVASKNGDIIGVKKEVKKIVKREINNKDVKKEIKRDRSKEVKKDSVMKELKKDVRDSKENLIKNVSKEVKKVIKKEIKPVVEKKEVKTTSKKLDSAAAPASKTIQEIKKVGVVKKAPVKKEVGKPNSTTKSNEKVEIKKTSAIKSMELKSVKEVSNKKAAESKVTLKAKPKPTSTASKSASKSDKNTKPVSVTKSSATKITGAVAASSVVGAAVAVTAAAIELNEKKDTIENSEKAKPEVNIENEPEIDTEKEPEIVAEKEIHAAYEATADIEELKLSEDNDLQDDVVVSPLPPEALSPEPSDSVSLTPSDTLSSAPLETVSPTPPLQNEAVSIEEKEVNEIKSIDQDLIPYEKEMLTDDDDNKDEAWNIGGSPNEAAEDKVETTGDVMTTSFMGQKEFGNVVDETEIVPTSSALEEPTFAQLDTDYKLEEEPIMVKTTEAPYMFSENRFDGEIETSVDDPLAGATMEGSFCSGMMPTRDDQEQQFNEFNIQRSEIEAPSDEPNYLDVNKDAKEFEDEDLDSDSVVRQGYAIREEHAAALHTDNYEQFEMLKSDATTELYSGPSTATEEIASEGKNVIQDSYKSTEYDNISDMVGKPNECLKQEESNQYSNVEMKNDLQNEFKYETSDMHGNEKQKEYEDNMETQNIPHSLKEDEIEASSEFETNSDMVAMQTSFHQYNDETNIETHDDKINIADENEDFAEEQEDVVRKESVVSITFNDDQEDYGSDDKYSRRKSGTESEDDVDLQRYLVKESCDPVDPDKLATNKMRNEHDSDDEDVVKSPTPHAIVDYEGQPEEVTGENEQYGLKEKDDESSMYMSKKNQDYDEKDHDSAEEEDDEEMIRHPTPPEEKIYSEEEMRDPIMPHFITTPHQTSDIIEQPLYEEPEDSGSERSQSPVVVVEQPVFGSAIQVDFPELVTVSGGTTPSEPQSPKSGFELKKFNSDAALGVMEALSEHDCSESSTHSPLCHEGAAAFDIPEEISDEKHKDFESDDLKYSAGCEDDLHCGNETDERVEALKTHSYPIQEDVELDSNAYASQVKELDATDYNIRYDETSNFNQDMKFHDNSFPADSYGQNKMQDTEIPDINIHDVSPVSREDNVDITQDIQFDQYSYQKTEIEFDQKLDPREDEFDVHSDAKSDNQDDNRSDIHDSRSDIHEDVTAEIHADDGFDINTDDRSDIHYDMKSTHLEEFDIQSDPTSIPAESITIDEKHEEVQAIKFCRDDYELYGHEEPGTVVKREIPSPSNFNSETENITSYSVSQLLESANIPSEHIGFEHQASSISYLSEQNIQEKEILYSEESIEQFSDHTNVQGDISFQNMSNVSSIDKNAGSLDSYETELKSQLQQEGNLDYQNSTHFDSSFSSTAQNVTTQEHLVESLNQGHGNFEDNVDASYEILTSASNISGTKTMLASELNLVDQELASALLMQENSSISQSSAYEDYSTKLIDGNLNSNDELCAISSQSAITDKEQGGDNLQREAYSHFEAEGASEKVRTNGFGSELHDTDLGGNLLNQTFQTENKSMTNGKDQAWMGSTEYRQETFGSNSDYSENFTTNNLAKIEQEASYIIDSRFHSDSPEDNVMRNDSSPDAPVDPAAKFAELKNALTTDSRSGFHNEDFTNNINCPGTGLIPTSPNNKTKNVNRENPYGESSEDEDSSSLPGTVSPYAYTNKAYSQEEEEDVDGNHIYKESPTSEVIKQFDGNNPQMETHRTTYSSEYADTHNTAGNTNYDFRLEEWEKPMGLPTPPDASQKTVAVKKTTKTLGKPSLDNGKLPSATSKSLTASPVKKLKPKTTKESSGSFDPVYVDLAYVPHHGDPQYCDVEFFHKIRARYYVFSGINPSKEVLNALLEAKKTWNEDLEVTIIPTYETDTLGYWMAQNQDDLAQYSIEVAPSASRCTVNLQDHETSCAAYRLEF